MEDLVAKTIELGRLMQCPKRYYISDACIPLNIFLGEEDGFFCVGFCKNLRPIDCIKLCGKSSGGMDFIDIAMSPMEALQIATYLIQAVGTFATTDEMIPIMHKKTGYNSAGILKRLEEIYWGD